MMGRIGLALIVLFLMAMPLIISTLHRYHLKIPVPLFGLDLLLNKLFKIDERLEREKDEFEKSGFFFREISSGRLLCLWSSLTQPSAIDIKLIRRFHPDAFLAFSWHKAKSTLFSREFGERYVIITNKPDRIGEIFTPEIQEICIRLGVLRYMTGSPSSLLPGIFWDSGKRESKLRCIQYLEVSSKESTSKKESMVQVCKKLAEKLGSLDMEGDEDQVFTGSLWKNSPLRKTKLTLLILFLFIFEAVLLTLLILLIEPLF